MKTLTNSHFFTNSNIFTQLTNDGDYFHHKHKFYEFFYIINGEISHLYNGKFETKLTTGDFCVIPPDVEHRFFRDKGNTCLHRDILIVPELIKTCCDFLSPNVFSILNNPTSCIIGHLPNGEIQYLEKEFDNFTIYRAQQSKENTEYEKILCINLMQRTSILSNNATNNLPVWLNQLLTSFQNTSLLKYGLPALLKDIHYSKPYICKSFKKFIGLTMTDYLLQARLTYASSLLKHTNMSITNIVSEIGISSIPYFNKSFKKAFNITPLNYRKTQ